MCVYIYICIYIYILYPIHILPYTVCMYIHIFRVDIHLDDFPVTHRPIIRAELVNLCRLAGLHGKMSIIDGIVSCHDSPMMESALYIFHMSKIMITLPLTHLPLKNLVMIWWNQQCYIVLVSLSIISGFTPQGHQTWIAGKSPTFFFWRFASLGKSDRDGGFPAGHVSWPEGNHA